MYNDSQGSTFILDYRNTWPLGTPVSLRLLSSHLCSSGFPLDNTNWMATMGSSYNSHFLVRWSFIKISVACNSRYMLKHKAS